MDISQFPELPEGTHKFINMMDGNDTARLVTHAASTTLFLRGMVDWMEQLNHHCVQLDTLTSPLFEEALKEKGNPLNGTDLSRIVLEEFERSAKDPSEDGRKRHEFLREFLLTSINITKILDVALREVLSSRHRKNPDMAMPDSFKQKLKTITGEDLTEEAMTELNQKLDSLSQHLRLISLLKDADCVHGALARAMQSMSPDVILPLFAGVLHGKGVVKVAQALMKSGDPEGRTAGLYTLMMFIGARRAIHDFEHMYLTGPIFKDTAFQEASLNQMDTCLEILGKDEDLWATVNKMTDKSAGPTESVRKGGRG